MGRRSNLQINPPDTKIDTDPEDVADIEGEDKMPWDDELNVWLQQNAQEDASVTFTLYRLDPEGQQPQKQVWSWKGVVPSNHDVGLKAGSGKYRAMLTLVDAQGKRYIKNKVIWIDEVYDEIRAELKAERDAKAAAAVPSASNTWAADIERLMALKAVFGPQGEAATGPVGAESFLALPKVQEAFAGALKAALGAQAEGFKAAGLVPAAPAAGAPAGSAPAADDDRITSKDLLELAVQHGPAFLDWLGIGDKAREFFKARAGGAT